MNNFTLLKRSLSEIGLSKLAQSLANIEKIYKIAALDLSKEKEVIKALLGIVNSLQSLSLDDEAPSGLYFPPYSTSMGPKNIIYSGEDLSGYTKAEIMKLGVPNFMNSFSNKFMKSRSDTLSGHDLRMYDQLIYEVEDLAKKISAEYTKITKPIELSNYQSTRTKVKRTDLAKAEKYITDQIVRMNNFIARISGGTDPTKGYLYYFMYAVGIEPEELEKDEPVVDFKRKDDRMLAEVMKSSYLSGLKNLKIDFNKMKQEIDSHFAQKLKISEEDFRDMLDLDSYFNIKTAAIDLGFEKDEEEENDSENYKDLLQQTQRITEQTTHHDFSKNVEFKKASEDILAGRFITQSGKAKYIMSPDLVLGAWEYLKEDLRIRYQIFLQTALDLLSYKQQKGITPHQSKEIKESKNAFASQVDKYVATRLKGILEVLDAR